MKGRRHMAKAACAALLLAASPLGAENDPTSYSLSWTYSRLAETDWRITTPDDETASVDGKTILFNTGDMEVAHMMAHTNKYDDYHRFSFSHTDLEPVSGAGSPIKLDIVIDYNGGDGWDTLKLPDAGKTSGPVAILFDLSAQEEAGRTYINACSFYAHAELKGPAGVYEATVTIEETSP